MTEALAICRAASRAYGTGAAAVVALGPTDCTVRPGARIALMGPSGSGKSTLLYLLAGLELPTTGSVAWPAIGSRDAVRAGRIGLVFQGPSLLAPLTVAENVALALILRGARDADARVGALAALDLLGLRSLADKLPEEISGGQAQRVAIARALAGEPKLVLADEPTGQLDLASRDLVIRVLIEASDRAGASLVVATHDEAVAARLDEHWRIHDGELRTRAGTGPGRPAPLSGLIEGNA